jgi:D-3-phosphoglycerate dehydrogenase
MPYTFVHVDAPPDAPLPDERDVLARSGLEAQLISSQCQDEEDVIELARDADAILDIRTPITRRVIENLPRCKVMVRYGIGVDTFDIPAATEHGIVLANVPDFCIEEVSNHALLLLLACAKKLVGLDAMVRAGGWQSLGQGIAPMGTIHGQTLGLVAFGKIPRALVGKARALGLHCLVYDPYVDEKTVRCYGAEPARFEEVLAQADYLSVHAPLTEETQRMFGEREFRLMKPTAFFINTARGKVVYEPALIRALQEGWIAGAGLDVLEEEPPALDNPLLSMDNVTLTPHSASYSDAAFAELRRRVMQEAVRVLKGYWPHSLVNPGVKERIRLEP